MDALLGISSVCIVVDKQADLAAAALRLAASGPGCHTSLVPGLELLGRPDEFGAVHYMDGHTSDQGDLGSVRVAGWRKVNNVLRPMLHAKLLVLGWHIWGEAEGQEISRLVWDRVWLGSANWTNQSYRHGEVGVWLDDAIIATQYASWLGTVIASSEPHTSTAVQPAPDLAEASFREPDEGDWDGWDLNHYHEAGEEM